MSETNEKSEGGIKTFFKQLFSKKEESPGRRSSKNREGNDDFRESIPIAPKRKSKRTAPQPPMELLEIAASTIYEPIYSTQKHVTSINDIEKQFSELTLKDSKRVSHAQVHIESESTNSKLKKTKIKSTKSSKEKKEYSAVSKTKSDLNGNANQTVIENRQVQKSSKKDDTKNTKSKSFLNEKLTKLGVSKSKSVKGEKSQVLLLKQQTNSKTDKPAIKSKNLDSEQKDVIAERLKHNEVENNSSQILENKTQQIETTICNNRNEDEANGSLTEETENNNEYDVTFEKIESVMQEVESFKLDIPKINDSESFFVIEMGLTNAIIKLDAIQMPKNELLKKKRKEGIVLIHEIFNQLDEHEKENHT